MPTTAATYTITLYYQNKPNAAGKVPLGLKYYFDGKQDAISLGKSIRPKDLLNGKVRSSAEDAALVNELIRSRVELLDDAAGSLEVPTWNKVKPLYLRLVARQEEEEKKQAFNQKKRSELIAQFRTMPTLEQQKLYRRAMELGIEAEVPPITQEQRDTITALHWSGVPVIGSAADRAALDAAAAENKLFKEQLQVYLDGLEHTNRKLWQVKKSWAKVLFEFETLREHPLTFSGMNAKFYNAYETFLFEDKDYYNNTFSNHVGWLKAFLSFCEKQEIRVNGYYKHFKVRWSS